MGQIVNRTWDVAVEWQRYVVWIRINVGYILAELPGVAALGYEVGDIQALLASFDVAFAKFCESEREVYVAARASEVSDAEKPTLIAALRRARGAFAPWLQEYHATVEKTQASSESTLPAVLLTGCGAELFKSQKALTDVIDAYVHELEGQPGA
jgi:hypothetical protein